LISVATVTVRRKKGEDFKGPSAGCKKKNKERKQNPVDLPRPEFSSGKKKERKKGRKRS